jgi:uncharacterized protein YbgA (DUF1722 family)
METAQHISQLMDFHKRNKYLLMLHSQVKLKEMGRLVANSKNFQETLQRVRKAF